MLLPFKLVTAPPDTLFEDEGRHEYIKIILRDAPRHGIVLSRWELAFLEDNYATRHFSQKQREVIDRIAMKYPHIY